METTIELLMSEYPELFKELCLISDLPVSDFVESYSRDDIKKLAFTFKKEYYSIWKELVRG